MLVEQIEAHARSPQIRINPSLIQMQHTLARNPMLNLQAPTILIGGTNGKGTTAGYLFTLMHQHLNLKVGLYTSPHLHYFHERIQLSHIAVNDDLLARHWHELVATVHTNTPLSFFEWTTLLAFYVFNIYATDINILEVGLGGKWDATNVIDPIAAVLVSLGKDHQHLLGNTYAEILTDKIAIARAYKPLFWGEQGSGAHDPTAQDLLQQVVAAQNLQLYRLGTDFDVRPTGVYWQDAQITPLPAAVASAPSFLQKNFGLAAAVWHWYCTNYNLPAKQQANAKLNYLPATINARCQRLRIASYEVITDACHNVDGALVFREYLYSHICQRKLTGFICLLADKDIAAILAILAPCLQPLYFFSVANNRAALRSHLPTAYQKNFYADFKSAWQAAAPPSKTNKSAVVICGSFYGLDTALTFLRTQASLAHQTT